MIQDDLSIYLYGGFLKLWYPPTHPFCRWNFHELNHPAWGTSILGNLHIHSESSTARTVVLPQLQGSSWTGALFENAGNPTRIGDGNGTKTLG